MPDIIELFTQKEPSTLCITIMKCLCILYNVPLNEERDYYAAVKKSIPIQSLVTMCSSYDKDSMNDEQILKLIDCIGSCNKDQEEESSQAIQSLFEWIMGVLNYHKSLQNMIESNDGSNIEEADEEAEMSSTDEEPDAILLKELKD